MRRIRLRETRKSRGLSVRALADKAGIDHSMLSRIETGERGLSVEMAEKLANALDTTAAQLLGLRENPGGNATTELKEDAEPFALAESDDIPIAVRRTSRDTVAPFRLKTDALDELGYHAGSIVFVDIGQVAVDGLKPGDCVIAQIYADMTAITLARQFIAPALLITNSRKANALPLNLDTDDVAIKGIIVGQYTPRQN